VAEKSDSRGATTRVLVVEDEHSIRQGLCDVLTFRGYSVVPVEDGATAVQTAQNGSFDLILLDVMLPELDGFSACRAIRDGGFEGAILMLTAKGSEDDVLSGFESGADDYVVKPFSVRELLARIQALLKRAKKPQRTVFQAGPFAIDAERGLAQSEGASIELSAREIGILEQLTRDPGRIVSRRVLLKEVWSMNNPSAVETRTVDVHVAKLRKKLGDTGSLLETVRGQGYRWSSAND
jgi:DNA-binding response OmpR family regulator